MHPRWHLKTELTNCSFNIGDHHEFAMDLTKSFWYWTNDQSTYFGPYRTKRGAGVSRRKFNSHVKPK